MVQFNVLEIEFMVISTKYFKKKMAAKTEEDVDHGSG